MLAGKKSVRLAIVISHPIQYYAPWFRFLANSHDLKIKVFYLWDFGVTNKKDPGFGQLVKWDIPLLDGYDHEFIPNVSSNPGTNSALGLNNPELVDALKKWQPSVILLFGYSYISHLRVLFARKLRGIPVLIRGDSHLLGKRSGWKSKLSRIGRRFIFRRFAGALAVGDANREYLIDSGIPADHIFVAPHSVDNDRFRNQSHSASTAALEWKKELRIAASAFVFLFVGKFEENKCPIDLLMAFELLNRKLPNQHLALVFVGSGTLEANLRTLVAERNIRNVYFAPFQNQSEICRAYALGDVLVLASKSETWGLVVNESMNFAKPAIVSTHVGCGPDLVIPGKTGWVFRAGEVESLSQAMAEAASNPERCKILGRRACQRIEDYSFASTTRGLIEAIQYLQTTHRIGPLSKISIGKLT